MKEYIYWLTAIATFLFLIPVFFIIKKRLYGHLSFIAILVYYIISLVSNFMSLHILPGSANMANALTILNNLLDGPLVLLFLIFFCPTIMAEKAVRYSFYTITLFILVLVFTNGFNNQTITITLGPGMLFTLAYSFYLFTQRIGGAFYEKNEVAFVLLLTGLLVAYTGYIIVYFFNYVLGETKEMESIMLLYDLTTIFSLFLSGIGYYKIKRPDDGFVSGHQPFKKPPHMMQNWDGAY
jgi:hypothetical protein